MNRGGHDPIDRGVDESHRTLLNLVERGDIGQRRTYFDRGADPNVRYTFQSGFLRRGRRGFKFGWNEQPLLVHALEASNVQVAMLLLERGADANATDDYGNTALWHAASLDEPALIRLMLAKGADATRVMPDGSTALMEAPNPSRSLEQSYRPRNQEVRTLLEKAAPGKLR